MIQIEYIGEEMVVIYSSKSRKLAISVKENSTSTYCDWLSGGINEIPTIVMWGRNDIRYAIVDCLFKKQLPLLLHMVMDINHCYSLP